MDSQILLELIRVSKHYDSPMGNQTLPVLADISLEMKAGDSLAVVGPSGSGKSTLLNIIGGLDSASSGEVLLTGRDISKMNPVDLSRIRNREIGFVFQQHHLLPQLTVLENVLVPCLMLQDHSQKRMALDRAQGLLARVGLEPRLSYWPGQLSGGERQRVAVVRALINQPKLLLADEPTGSLDRTTALEIAELLVELNRQEGIALILVTHSLELAGRMNRVMELRDGILVPWDKSG